MVLLTDLYNPGEKCLGVEGRRGVDLCLTQFILTRVHQGSTSLYPGSFFTPIITTAHHTQSLGHTPGADLGFVQTEAYIT